MVTVNVHQAKTQLSRYLNLALKGEKVILCRRNIPLVELRRVKEPKPKRAIGLCKAKFELPDSFFEPLPESFLSHFKNPR